MPEAADQGAHSVLFLGTDPPLCDLLRASARELGVSMHGCRTLAGLASAASLKPARVLALELAALAPGRLPEEVLDRMQAETGLRPLLLCLGDGEVAQREKGAIQLLPPFDGVRLIEALAGLLRLPVPERGRVLLLGDSPVRDDHYARLLRAARIRVEVVSDPGQVAAVVERLRPHLAILDLDMDTAGEGPLDGRVRDCPACQDLPIIFLSGDLPDPETVGERRIGGDDYLAKPVAPEHLLALVRARLEGAQGPGGPSQVRVAGADLLLTAVHFLQRLDKEVTEGADPSRGQAILYLEPTPPPGPPPSDVPGLRRLLTDLLGTLVEPGDRAAWLSDLGLALWVSRRDDAEVAAFAERILRALTAPSASARAYPALRTLSIGLGHFLPPADDAQTLISRAQSACASARATGGSRVEVHRCPGTEALRDGPVDSPALGSDQAIAALLRRALRGEGFRLVYQPILSLRKGADQRYEVLLRLRTPDGAIIPPLTFLPVAQRQGLLPILDRWVLSGALWTLRQERDAGRPTRFLIHQTPESLVTPNWLESVRDEILRLDLIRQRPVLEFSALGILANEPRARQIFPELARLGIEVCLTGITDSPAHLRLIRRRGIVLVKLARELASQGNPGALKTTVEGLHALGVRVIASGIEEPEMIGRVWSSGVDYIQGNLIQFPEETLVYDFGGTSLG